MLFAVIIGLATNVGWAQTTIYVNATQEGTGDGTIASPFKTIEEAIQKTHEGDIIRIANGTYEVLDLAITKPMSFIGEGAINSQTVIYGNFIISAGVNDKVSFLNLTLENKEQTYTSPNKPTPIILMQKGGAMLTLDNCIMNNHANGWGSGYGGGVNEKMSISIQSDSTAVGEITVKNSTLNIDGNYQTGISCNGTLKKLTFEKSKVLDTAKHTQCFGIDVHCHGMEVVIDESEIKLGNYYYALYVLGLDQTIYIKNHSVIQGWAAIYANAVASNSTIYVTDSKLIGYSEMTGNSNNFSTIAIQAVKNVRVIVTNSEIQTRIKDVNTAPMTPIAFSLNTYIDDSWADKCVVELRGTTKISHTLQEGAERFILDESDKWNRVLADPSVTLEYYNASDESEMDAIKIWGQGDTLRTATNTIATALESVIATDKIVLPAGTYGGFELKKNNVTLEGASGETFIKGKKQYTGSSVACIAANNVTLKNLSFLGELSEEVRPTGLYLGGGTITVDNCIFEDKNLNTGIYSEPGSTTGNLLIQNCKFNVFDKNLLLSAGRENATVKNNIFTDSDISVAKNTGTNVVMNNEFHNCVVKVQDGVKFKNNRMYPGGQKYLYSVRPDGFTGVVDLSGNYWGSSRPYFSELIEYSRAPMASVNVYPYFNDESLQTSIAPSVENGKITIIADPTDFKANGAYLQEMINYAATLNPIPEIVLAAGTYQGNFVMKEGVNVTGTFANRDSTILDGGTSGRVVSQKRATAKYTKVWQTEYAFEKETVWKNLIIRNGKLTDVNKDVYGAAAGVFLSKNGVLDNCVIRGNITEGTGIKAGGVLLESGGCMQNCTIEDNKTCDSYAGVMIQGAGTVQNCIVRYNEVTSDEHSAGIGTRYVDPSTNDTHTVLIEGCDIYQNKTNGGGLSGLTLNKIKGCIYVKNTKIHDNYDLKGIKSGVTTGYSEGTAGVENINLINCLVYNNGRSSTSSSKSQNGIVAESGTNILNCTIWDNAGEHSGIYAIESGNPVITTTNTIAQDYYGKLHNSDNVTSSRHIVTYSLIPTVRQELLAERNGQGNIIGEVTAKMFTDSIIGNYSPALNAPSIDKGVIGSWKSSDKDLAGISRIQGSNIDMGAYESSLSADAKPVKITSVPDIISFGDTVRLFANYKNVKYEFETNTGDVLGWHIDKGDTSVVALKPGTATLKVSTTMETNTISSLLVVTVEKKMISVNTTCLSVKDTTYGCRYDGNVSMNGALSDKDKLFNGLVEGHKEVELVQLTGTVSSEEAGETVPVSLVAQLTGKDASYYTLAPINNITMKINRKVLTITASDASRKYGEANPGFTVQCSGFADKEDIKVLGGELKFACAAAKESLAGTYDIEPYGYTSSNYKIKYVKGTLTVGTVDPKVELTGAVVDPISKDKVILTGRLVHKGGHPDETVVKVGFTQRGQTLTSIPETLTAAGKFTSTTNVLDNAEYEYQATAQINEEKLVTSVPQSVTVNKEYTVQAIQFATLIGKVEYGSSPVALAAVSDQEKAVGNYIYKVESGNDVVRIDGETLTIQKAGTAIISVSRPADQTGRFTAASALQTVEVVKKPVRVVNRSVVTKPYDNTLVALMNISELKVVDAAGQEVSDVSLIGSLTGKYADKNVGDSKKIVVSGVELNDEVNYELLGYGVVGNITKADLSISITNATRRYNETRARYTLVYNGFKGEDNEYTPGIHTGTIQVVEQDNVLSIPTDGLTFPNYNLSTGTATVAIEKGTPKVVTYSNGNKVLGIVVDSAGWKVELGSGQSINKNKQAFATYSDESDNTQTVYGALLSGTETSVTVKPGDVMTRAVATGLTTYGQRMKITFTKGASIESTDPNILKIVEMGDGNATVEAVGIGKAAIVAVASDNKGADLLEANIEPCQVNIDTGGTVTKVYDGTNAAHVASLKTTGIYAGDDVSLSYSTFTYNDKNVDNGIRLTPSRTIELVGVKAANYEIGTVSLVGSITQRALDVKSVTKEYNGKSSDDAVLSYQADGLVEGEVIPLKVDWDSNVNAGIYQNGVTASLTVNSNYKMISPASISGTITQARIVATIGAMEVGSATADAFNSALKKSDFFTLASTGEKFSIQNLSGYEPAITFSNGTFNVSGGDTQNYTFVYAKGNGTYTVKTSSGGSITVPVESVSLDKSELTLPRLTSYILKATVNPDNATNRKVIWMSSDDKIVKVDANGKVTAVAVGRATVTVTTEDGGMTATCEVIVDFATGLEEAIANTSVYGKKRQVVIEPLAPMPVMIVNMMGKIVYRSRISGATYVPVAAGLYIVKLGADCNIQIRKVNVR